MVRRGITNNCAIQHNWLYFLKEADHPGTMYTTKLKTLAAVVVAVLCVQGLSILRESHSRNNSAIAYLKDNQNYMFVQDGGQNDGKGLKNSDLEGIVNMDKGRDIPSSNNDSRSAIFMRMMRQKASTAGTIYLASVDYGYKDMARNLYETSFLKFNITNYAFVGSDPQVCDELTQIGITCGVYILDKDASQPSRFGSPAFKRKTHIKTKIVLDALLNGLTTILTDLDIVFLQDPGPHFTCAECDFEISDNGNELNSGFFIARPTLTSIAFFNLTWQRSLTQKQDPQQEILNVAVGELNSTLNYRVLDRYTFANGKDFFTHHRRDLKGDNPCSECVIVHNNWIVSSQAKVYRFKEYGLWEVDSDGYYSNVDNKYISFDLPDYLGEPPTARRQIDALRTAMVLGAVLERIVILPAFRTGKTLRSLTKFCCIISFDERFQGWYRESVFLQHHKVPDRVRNSVSPAYHITSNRSLPEEGKEAFRSRHPNTGPTADELRERFGASKFSILRFNSLYVRFVSDVLLSVYAKQHKGFKC